MFRATLASVALAAILVPAHAFAGVPGSKLPVPVSGDRFLCIAVDGDDAVAISGTVFVTNEDPITVPQDFVASVRADVELVVWEDGLLANIANVALKGSLRSGMPTPGTAYGLSADQDASEIESVRLLAHVNGEKTATLNLPGQESRTIPCQAISFPANI